MECTGSQSSCRGNISEDRVPDKRRKPEEKGSLAEKLQDVKPAGSLTPGMENPDSEEIKGETSQYGIVTEEMASNRV